MRVTDINDLLGIHIDDEDVDTIGGWILTENFEAKQGDVVSFEKYNFKIIEMEDHHIRYIEVTKAPDDETVQSIDFAADKEAI
jgi:CBS domain containing-hemolysin-like protein